MEALHVGAVAAKAGRPVHKTGIGRVEIAEELEGTAEDGGEALAEELFESDGEDDGVAIPSSCLD